MIIKCDRCGADGFNPKQMRKGQIVLGRYKKLRFKLDLCPNCYERGSVFYVRKGESNNATH